MLQFIGDMIGINGGAILFGALLLFKGFKVL